MNLRLWSLFPVRGTSSRFKERQSKYEHRDPSFCWPTVRSSVTNIVLVHFFVHVWGNPTEKLWNARTTNQTHAWFDSPGPCAEQKRKPIAAILPARTTIGREISSLITAFVTIPADLLSFLIAKLQYENSSSGLTKRRKSGHYVLIAKNKDGN